MELLRKTPPDAPAGIAAQAARARAGVVVTLAALDGVTGDL
jgi:hypothetical protein